MSLPKQTNGSVSYNLDIRHPNQAEA